MRYPDGRLGISWCLSTNWTSSGKNITSSWGNSGHLVLPVMLLSLGFMPKRRFGAQCGTHLLLCGGSRLGGFAGNLLVWQVFDHHSVSRQHPWRDELFWGRDFLGGVTDKVVRIGSDLILPRRPGMAVRGPGRVFIPKRCWEAVSRLLQRSILEKLAC